MREAETVTLLPFPRDDEVFVGRARSLLEDLDGEAGGAPERLEALLRLEFPGAVVKRRDRLAALDGSNEAWYVYRDGTAARWPTKAEPRGSDHSGVAGDGKRRSDAPDSGLPDDRRIDDPLPADPVQETQTGRAPDQTLLQAGTHLDTDSGRAVALITEQG